MGGGGGGAVSWPKPEQIAELKRSAEQAASESDFGTLLSDEFAGYLAAFNSRDVKAVRERLEDIKQAIHEKIEGSVDTLFGGSVAKHTFIDGLSDIDTLLILNDTELAGKKPAIALNALYSILREKLRGIAEVERGDLAVTVAFPGGMDIQCLPAIKTSDGLKIASVKNKNEWAEIDPNRFNEALTAVNNSCGNKLVPTIKLAKAVNARLPPEIRLTGYHIEAIAVSAFASYTDEMTPSRMLPVLFERAARIVLAPIRDRSGQSVHVDGYLGAENSPERQQISHVLNRVAKRMRNATAGTNIDQWRALFE